MPKHKSGRNPLTAEENAPGVGTYVKLGELFRDAKEDSKLMRRQKREMRAVSKYEAWLARQPKKKKVVLSAKEKARRKRLSDLATLRGQPPPKFGSGPGETLKSIEREIVKQVAKANKISKRTLGKAISEFLKLTKKTGIVGGGPLTDLANNIFNDKRSKYAYNLKDGEKHALQIDKEGHTAFGRFVGPGTFTIENLKELIEKYGSLDKALDSQSFISEVDRGALAHDLRYMLSKANPALIRRADERYLQVLKKYLKEEKFNVTPALLAIEAKIKAEDKGILAPDKFVKAHSGKPSEEDVKLAQETLGTLNKQGLGRPLRKR